MTRALGIAVAVAIASATAGCDRAPGDIAASSAPPPVPTAVGAGAGPRPEPATAGWSSPEVYGAYLIVKRTLRRHLARSPANRGFTSRRRESLAHLLSS
jgi:hypothetical protein